LLEGVLRFAAVGGIARDGPGAGGFGDEGFDELRAAGVAEEGLVAEEKQGGDGFAFGEAGEEFFVGDAGHAKSEFTSFLAARETPPAEEKNRKSLNAEVTETGHRGHGDGTLLET
jgi:hypothetical protein